MEISNNINTLNLSIKKDFINVENEQENQTFDKIIDKLDFDKVLTYNIGNKFSVLNENLKDLANKIKEKITQRITRVKEYSCIK
ncbi:MAG: hypothetical protein ACP5RD_02175 [bacterium]